MWKSVSIGKKDIKSRTIGRPYVHCRKSSGIKREYICIATSEIERLFNSICRWIDNRSPGAIVYGRPG